MDSQSVPTEGGIAFAGFVRFADPALFAAHAFHQCKDRFGRSVMPEAAIDNSATRTGVVIEDCSIWSSTVARLGGTGSIFASDEDLTGADQGASRVGDRFSNPQESLGALRGAISLDIGPLAWRRVHGCGGLSMDVVSERTDGARRATMRYAQAGRIVRS